MWNCENWFKLTPRQGSCARSSLLTRQCARAYLSLWVCVNSRVRALLLSLPSPPLLSAPPCPLTADTKTQRDRMPGARYRAASLNMAVQPPSQATNWKRRRRWVDWHVGKVCPLTSGDSFTTVSWRLTTSARRTTDRLQIMFPRLQSSSGSCDLIYHLPLQETVHREN